MKFGNYITSHQIPRFKQYYIPYNMLKELVKQSAREIKGDSEACVMLDDLLNWSEREKIGLFPQYMIKTSTDAMHGVSALAHFVDEWENALKNATWLANIEVKMLEDQLKILFGRLPELQEKHFRANAPRLRDSERLVKDVDRCGNLLRDLHLFVSVNARGFQKIIKKLDKLVGTKVLPWTLVRLANQPLATVPLGDFLVPISDLYAHARALSNPPSNHSEKWDPPENFERSTVKYWVLAENSLDLKLRLCKHVPILMFGREPRPKKFETLPHSAWITSIYYDNAVGDVYQTRLKREEGGKLFRARWYGRDIGEKVFVERKTHHESWNAEESVKQRVIMAPSQVGQLFSGTLDLEREFRVRAITNQMKPQAAAEGLYLAQEIREAFQKRKLEPSTRVLYRRSQFQSSESNDIRITVDSDMQFIEEFGKGRVGEGAADNWHRPMTDAVPRSERFLFPHTILEVKLQVEPPDFLKDILALPYVFVVHKFSKFLTAEAILHQPRLKMLPRWMEDPTMHDALLHLHRHCENLPHGQSHKFDNDDSQDVVIPSGEKEQALTREVSQRHETKRSTRPLEIEASEPQADRHAASTEADNDANTSARKYTGEHGEHDSSYDNDDSPQTGANANEDGVSTNRCGPSDQNQKERRGDSMFVDLPPILPKFQGKIAKIEPKTYFANERTFIQWLGVGVLLVTLSLGLIGVGTSTARVAGFALFPIAVIFVIYAIGSYHWRAYHLNQGSSTSYHDPYGPTALSVALLASMATVLIIGMLSDK